MYCVTVNAYIMLLLLTNNMLTIFPVTFVISLLSTEISQGFYDIFLNNVPANVSGCLTHSSCFPWKICVEIKIHMQHSWDEYKLFDTAQRLFGKRGINILCQVS